MILTFLGTSAANAYPEAFCQCENCREARALGGPSLRKRSAALINDDLLIDLGPDIMVAAQMHGVPLTHVRYCLQTHAHADHLDASHLLSRSPGFGVVGAPRLHFYASSGTLQHMARTFERDLASESLLDPQVRERLNLDIHTIEANKPFYAGPYRVIPLPANHDPTVEPLLYALSAEGHSLFYGADTASLPEETWRAFHDHKLEFDLVILDHTYGPDEPGSDHLSAHQVSEHASRMRAEGLLAEGGRFFATHIAHQGNPVHPKLAAFASPHGYEIAFDGLSLTVPGGVG
jgi:phosphoribosyl 1,2-cyclic phosphate phosphodiesterase